MTTKQQLHLVHFSKCSIANFVYNFPYIQWILVTLDVLQIHLGYLLAVS